MAGNYVLLERIELNASAASVTFSNIPQTGYTDLKVVASSRGSSSGPAEANRIHFNGDTTNTNYTGKRLLGSGSAASSDQTTAITPGFFNDLAGATANTFANSEVYIPNYTGSNSKSYSIDTVTENNGTEAYAGLVAVRWSGTAAITSMTFTPESSGNFVSGSTFSLYGLAAVGTTPVTAPKATGGNIVANDGTYWYHAFTSSGNFVPQVGLTCDYLVVAGGGGGFIGQTTDEYGGGGGAGGLRSTVTATGGGGALESAISVASGTNYPITVGAGGAGGASGSNSTFSTITSTGGGFGNGITGGSGGGARAVVGTATGGNGTTNQGRAGGTGTLILGTSSASGGGGGADTAGGNGSGNTGGNGGNGVSISAFASPTNTGVSNFYAGGGGGAGGVTNGSGGSGGGGAGNRTGVAGSGTPNTGSGGGGAYGVGVGTGTPGAGGSGIVIIRYLAS